MSIERLRSLASMIAQHIDRTVDGRKRLQKEIMLLQKKGYPTDYSFNTHYYGAYSEELFSDLKLLESIEVVNESVVTGGAFRTYRIQVRESFTSVIDSSYCADIEKLEQASVTELELGATYLLYRDKGFTKDDALNSLKSTKSDIATEANMGRAFRLLEKLALML